MLWLLSEDTEKNFLTGECQIVILFFLWATDAERWEYLGEMCRDVGCPCTIVSIWIEERSLKLEDSLPSIPDVLQLITVASHLYTVCYKNNNCIPIMFSLCKSECHMIHLQTLCSHSGFLIT